VEEFPVFRRYI